MKQFNMITMDNLIMALDAKQNICVWNKDKTLDIPMIDCKVYNLYDCGVDFSNYLIDDLGIDFSGIRVVIYKK